MNTDLLSLVVLEVISGLDEGCKVWFRNNGSIQVGRTDWADFVIADDPHVSSVHFELACDHQRCWIRDLESSNGTWLNGERIREASVYEGDQIQAGDTCFRVQISGGKRRPEPESITETQVSTAKPQPIAEPEPVNEMDFLMESAMRGIAG